MSASDPSQTPHEYLPELPYPEELQQWLGDGFMVESFLGQGGMGAVYRGLQLPLRRPIAIKILRKGAGNDDFGFEERFKREAYAMAALTHPNIVQVYDCGDAGGDFLFISMELVEGGDLSQALGGGKVTPESALALIGPICDGLQFAHEHGIVHRDIKPANIFLTPDGKPKVADFGLAKQFDAKATLMTKTGLGMGTPDYAAPEQYDQLPDIDHRADIYALGVMFYQMLTGSLPRGAYKPPSKRVAIDPRLDEVVEKAMEQDRNQRYQTVAEMRRDIQHIITTWMAQPKQAPAKTAAVPPAQAPRTPGAVPARPAATRSGPVRTAAAPRPMPHSYVPPPQKSSAMPLVIGGMAAIAVGAFFFVKKSKPASAEPSAPASAQASSPTTSSTGSSASASASTTSSTPPTTSPPSPVAPSYVNPLGMKFVPVPGTDALFCMHETRRQDYDAFAADVGIRAAGDGWWQRQERERIPCGAEPSHPVVGVSYHDALAFCAWLGKKDGRNYRLPTDREWSIAVGIGDEEKPGPNDSPQSLHNKLPNRYPWGANFPPPNTGLVGNYSDANAAGQFPTFSAVEGYDDGFMTTAPVMTFQPNALGIYDLGGNVWEWVEDLYTPGRNERALRGGSWHIWRATDLLSSTRAHRTPDNRGNNHGFRCVIASTASSAVTRVPSPATPSSVKPAAAPPPAGDPYLAQLASSFTARYDEVARKPFEKRVADLKQSYIDNGLARALATAQAQGNLQAALALTTEKTEMEKGRDIPAQDPADVSPTLKGLRDSYRSTLAAHEHARRTAAEPLYDIYVTALEKYVIDLTKAGKIDEAQKVRELRNRIADEKSKGANPAARTTNESFTNSLGMKFVPVPGTTILMCVHETRRADFAAYAAASTTPVSSAWRTPQHNNVPLAAVDDHPVVEMKWEEAKAFCDWLSQKEGRAYRLPTDREWSFAVGIADREDKDTAPAALNIGIKDEYPWGKGWPPPKGAGNFADETSKTLFPGMVIIAGYTDGHAGTSPVMSFEPNTLGIYDLAGNAWEWCEDWQNQGRNQHVVRGGAWTTNSAEQALSSLRGAASVRTPDRGFRVVTETLPAAR